MKDSRSNCPIQKLPKQPDLSRLIEELIDNHVGDRSIAYILGCLEIVKANCLLRSKNR